MIFTYRRKHPVLILLNLLIKQSISPRFRYFASPLTYGNHLWHRIFSVLRFGLSKPLHWQLAKIAFVLIHIFNLLGVAECQIFQEFMVQLLHMQPISKKLGLWSTFWKNIAVCLETVFICIKMTKMENFMPKNGLTQK